MIAPTGAAAAGLTGTAFVAGGAVTASVAAIGEARVSMRLPAQSNSVSNRKSTQGNPPGIKALYSS